MSPISSGSASFGRGTPTNFRLIGSRDHVLGVSAVAAMCRAAWHAHGPEPLRIATAKFTRRVSRNGSVFCLDGDGVVPPGAAVSLRGELGGQHVLCCFVEDETSHPCERVADTAHSIEDLRTDGGFSGHGRFSAPDMESFLLVLVEMNKRIVRAGCGLGTHQRLEHTSIDALECRAVMSARDLTLRVSNISTRAFGGRLYVLNALEHAWPDGTAHRFRFTVSVEETC